VPFNASIAEFTVAGVPLNGFFGHKWYIGSDDSIDATALKHFIDQSLMELNDDYAVERKSALKDITVDVLPEKIFMEFMAKKGKVGGQHKFPRVLKGSLLEEWTEFIKMNT
jgi:hypothetical protein